MKKLFCIFLALAIVLTFGGCASKETEKQEMVEYPNRIEDTLVNDFAGVLSTETKEEIADAGDKALDKLKTQVLVVSVESLGGESVQEYARELSKRWGLDDADKGIGALLLVAKEEREVHISIGYGWDKLITDEEIDNILETYAVSYIKNGNLNDGVKGAYSALLDKLYAIVKEGLSGIDKNDNIITVPNFVGMTVEQIANNPEYLEWFKFNDYAYIYDDRPEGTVIDQSLEVGISVKKGVRDITLTVSRGKRMEPVPDVIGLHRDEAKQKLDNAGFEVTYRLEQSEEVEEGYIIALDPADSTLPYGAEVQMVVSNGDSPLEAVEIPDVTRLGLKEAIEALQEVGFLKDVELTEEGLSKFAQTNVTYVFSEFPAGTVIAQTPAEGEANVETPFTFEVSNGYRAMEIDVPLPLRSFSIDMKVYVSGQAFAAYDDIYPSAALSQLIKVEQEKELYMVTVLVSKHGENNFVKYAEYMVNTIERTVTQMSMDPDVLS